MKEMEKILKIENLEYNNLETSLYLAAEVGNVLLIKNGELQQNVINVHSKNTELLLQQQELKSAKSNHFSYQLQVKELATEKEALINKYGKLVETVNHFENHQLIKRQRRAEIRTNF